MSLHREPDDRDMERIYREHARTVYRFLLAQCRDAELAEELTQETFCQALNAIDRFDGRSKLSVWLCQIARHLWYKHLRRAGREAPLPEGEPDPPGPSAEQTVTERQSHLDLLGRIHALPEPTREVVYLRVFGELSFKEIGQILNRTETWARVTFYRAKLDLAKGGDENA